MFMTPLEEDNHHVDRVQQFQDRESFGELYHRHYRTVHRVIARIVLNEAIAEELAQDTFMKAAEQIHTFQKRSSFKTWVCRIGVNAANGHLRRQRTARRHSETLRVDSEARSRSHSPRDSLFWKEENQRVSRAMETLSPVLRTALALTVLEDQDVAEAARSQGCTRGTMYWRVHQARKQLKKALNHE